jgi:(2S)-methylsuccinyl-CoA dehydrogenase
MSIPESLWRHGHGVSGHDHYHRRAVAGSLGAAGSLITRPEIVARALLGGTKLASSGCRALLWRVDGGGVGDCRIRVLMWPRLAAGPFPLWHPMGNRAMLSMGAKPVYVCGRGDLDRLLARTDPDVSRGRVVCRCLSSKKSAVMGMDFVIRQPHGGLCAARPRRTLGIAACIPSPCTMKTTSFRAANLVGETAVRIVAFICR